MRMGPGYFPFVLGGLLAVLGLVVAALALRRTREAIRPWALRPLVLVLGAVVGFAILLQPVGLVLSTLILIVISRLAGWEFRIREVLFLCLLLTAMTVGLFVYGLGLPLNLWFRGSVP